MYVRICACVRACVRVSVCLCVCVSVYDRSQRDEAQKWEDVKSQGDRNVGNEDASNNKWLKPSALISKP